MRYCMTFLVWWNENKNSESLIDDYKNYRLDATSSEEKPMSYKRWAWTQYQETHAI